MVLSQPITLVGAGRTDAGVHAKTMVAHFNTTTPYNVLTLTTRLNAFLPSDIAIKALHPVVENAHARFNATARTYEYWVIQTKNPFYKDSAHYVRQPLDIKAMNKAALLLLQHRDFECFSKTNSDVHTFFCKITHAQWQEKAGVLVFTISANRFLRNMVRAIVGTLLEIGMQKKTVQDLEYIIASKSRSNAGPSVPAKGLYLTKINYPEHIYGAF